MATLQGLMGQVNRGTAISQRDLVLVHGTDIHLHLHAC